MNNTPVYYETSSYAREHGELDQYRASAQANSDCRDLIDRTIAEHFDGMHLDRSALDIVLAEFTPDRIGIVLAATLIDREHDGRFSTINKAWARAWKMPRVAPNSFSNPLQWIVLRSHSAILDGFVSMFIKAIA